MDEIVSLQSASNRTRLGFECECWNQNIGDEVRAAGGLGPDTWNFGPSS